MTPTLLLSTWSLPAAKALGQAAQDEGWRAIAVEEVPKSGMKGEVVYYGGSDRALEVAARFGIALIEPPFDLLVSLPIEFRRREVQFARFDDLVRLRKPTFVKPADSLNKSFDAGIYEKVSDIRTGEGVSGDSPVLVAEPVEWSAEYRCFILNKQVVAWSPYMSFSRPNWKPFGKGTLASQVPPGLTAICKRLFMKPGVSFPPAFVMDVGLVDDRGWAVVEFNPVWCSGVLGAEPRKVLGVLRRACQAKNQLRDDDRAWVLNRAKASRS